LALFFSIDEKKQKSRLVIICAKIRQPAFEQMILRLSPWLEPTLAEKSFWKCNLQVCAGSLTFFSTNNYYAG
jgi:hypothetical protein